MRLVAIAGRRQEVLGPGLGPLDGATERTGDGGDQHVLRIGVTLDAEPAADLWRAHAHAILGESEDPGDGAAHGERHLGRAPDAEHPAQRVDNGEHAARFDRHAGHPGIDEVALDDHRGLGEASVGVADHDAVPAGKIVGPVGVNTRRAAGERRRGRRGRRQHLVLDADPLGGVGGAVPILRDDNHHGLAGVADDRPG